MNTLIANIGQLVTPRGRDALVGREMSELFRLEKASVLIEDGRIHSIGIHPTNAEIDRVIDAGGGVVLPGLIDCHRHLTQTDWDAVGLQPSPSPARAMSSIGRALRRGTRMGIVGMELKCADELDAMSRLSSSRAAADGSGPRTWGTVLSWERDENAQTRADRITRLIGEIIPHARRHRTAAFCDAACGAGGYTAREGETILRAGRGAGLRSKVHALLGGTHEAAGLAVAVGATSLDHADEVPLRAAREMAARRLVSVLMPAEGLLGRGTYPRARAFVERELPVAVATNFGAGEEGVESLWVIVALAVRFLGLTLDETITAVTLNAAAALRVADETGSIEPGKWADLVVLDVDDLRDVLCGIGANPVRTTIIRGEPVHTS